MKDRSGSDTDRQQRDQKDKPNNETDQRQKTPKTKTLRKTLASVRRR